MKFNISLRKVLFTWWNPAMSLRKSLEQAIGFEPMMNGSAVRRLWPLGYAREIGTRERIRTFNIRFLRPAPLPIWPRVQKTGQSGMIRSCEHLLPKQARMAICGTLCEGWLRVKDSNLHLLVQSQPSCRLDEPEKLAGKAGLEPARSSLKNWLRDALHSSPKRITE